MINALPNISNIIPGDTISSPRDTKKKVRVPYRIYIAVNGEGYGHSSRALSVASHFDPDCVLMGSYGYVLERLQRAGYPTVEIRPEFKLFGEDGSFELSKTILKNSAWPLMVNKLTREEAKILKQNDITCVLSDCRAAAVFAAAKLGLPCIFMTNQTQFDQFFQRGNSRANNLTGLARRRSEENPLQDAFYSAVEPSIELVAKTVFQHVDEFVIGDFPPPDTICLPLLSRRPQVMKLQRMVGPITTWRSDEVIPYPRPGFGPYVVGSLGGHQYRLPLFNALIEAAKLLPEVQFEIFSSFRSDETLANVHITDFTDRPERYFKAADLVVTQAGHSTAMELLSLGKQSILVPDYKQSEQENNATRMVELGVASQLSYTGLTGAILAQRIQHHLQLRSYELNAMRLSRMADKLNGAQKVAEIVTDYAMRLLAY